MIPPSHPDNSGFDCPPWGTGALKKRQGGIKTDKF